MSSNESIMSKINQFRDDRNWRQFHNEKDLAISISIEASELLELFQWKSSTEVKDKKLSRIKEELADVLIYSYMMADNLDLDVEEIISEKLKLNEKKYPVDKAKNKNDKYTEL
ncbi:nucleotide pyrophosphohydrolase [Tetragenococcus osmophilus]|uniref:Nucleotide pyrophosphohydrolase n=1 Tax=Tetragenococcus osmophilus TaxID=526944 RepID=A0AA37XKJ7_9ENTE|nr:nucleotide pyrophosphohydrolase [Tetragenococcus osmophilus]AYW48401.1 nucleotide pyrophosphohydrolase [Tetragenococcus osmophilus]GMA54237.1 nucleotide pyrophosphohydrolase [Alicyclobacillus contaminans]GMA71886.1 nucleotide pyrophosphohydrolase [Tetragenococcus osmophilus]